MALARRAIALDFVSGRVSGDLLRPNRRRRARALGQPRTSDRLPAWTAQHGVHVLPVESFLAESRDFANRLLAAMEERIAGIEARTLRPQIEVDVPSLRQQHETWRTELASYFREHEPDMPWDETETALRTIAEKREIRL